MKSQVEKTIIGKDIIVEELEEVCDGGVAIESIIQLVIALMTVRRKV